MSSGTPGDATRFAVLLFTDICDSTALKSRHGAPAFRAAIELHNALFERLAAEQGITLVKNSGDGYLARTTSVAAAIDFALRLQHGLHTLAWPEFPLVTRVGIHAGEIMEVMTMGLVDVLAPAADVAARIMGLAVGGQILLTRWPFDEGRHYLRAHPPIGRGEPPTLEWLAHGPYLLKGCDEPVEIFEVGASDIAPLSAPPDGEKARRAMRPGEEETLGWRPAAGLEIPGRPDWRLEKKLGEGGFGEVWLAEQAKLRERRVFKFCFDEERLRSFKRELTFFRLIRDALGERADIARLYDVKLDRPPFFLESEYAEHGNLVEWCAARGGPAAVPLAGRLGIVAQIAEAVAAAHSIGILHKDLKPQNILMHPRAGGEDAPQLTDFGIGALADRVALAAHEITAAGFTAMTMPGEKGHGSGSSMTRLYAPPEQLTGQPFTIQGDVYALGVILFQLVIGDFGRALAPGWEREVKDEILREDIAACVDGDPAQRLPSASELAVRLRTLGERRLALETRRQRAVLGLRRRRRARLALAGSGLAALVAVALGIGFLRERGLRQRAGAAEKLALFRLQHAAKARDAAENLITEAVFGLRKKLMSLGKVELMEDMVKAADDYYRRLPEDLFDDGARRDLVSLSLNRALIEEALGRDVESEHHLRESLRLAQEIAARAPGDDQLREEIGNARLGLCQIFADRNDRDALARQARDLSGETEKVLAGNPRALWALHHQAMAELMTAQELVRSVGDLAGGMQRFQKAQELAGRLRETGGETVAACEVEGLLHYSRAKIVERLGQLDAIITEYETSMKCFARALELGGDSALLREMHVGAMHQNGHYLRQRARERHDAEGVAQGEQLLRTAFEGRRRLVELEPGRAEWWRDLAHSYNVQAAILIDAGDLAGARRHYQDEMKCRNEAIARQPNRPLLYEERGYSRFQLALWLEKTEPADSAALADLLSSSIDDWCLAREKSGYHQVYWGNLDQQLAKLLPLAQRDSAQVLPFLSQARTRVGSLLGKITDQNSVPHNYEQLLQSEKETLTRIGRSAEAAALEPLLAAVKDDPSVRKGALMDTRDKAIGLLNTWRHASEADKAAKAEELRSFHRTRTAALEKDEQQFSPHDFNSLRGGLDTALGVRLLEGGETAEAEPVLRRALADRTAALAASANDGQRADRTIDVAWARFNLGSAFVALGKVEEGRKVRLQGLADFEKLGREASRVDCLELAAARWREVAEGYPKGVPDPDPIFSFGKAVELSREARRLGGPARTGNGYEDAWLHYGYAIALRDGERLAEAEPALREAIEKAQRALSAGSASEKPSGVSQLALFHGDLAKLLNTTGRSAEAVQHLDAAVALLDAQEAEAGQPGTEFKARRDFLAAVRRELK